MAVHVAAPSAELAAFCRRHHITKLSLFGSVLGDDFGPQSDIDVLVEFEAGYVPGWDFFVLQDELSELLGRTVDLHTPEFLSPYFRAKAQAEAKAQYVAR